MLQLLFVVLALSNVSCATYNVFHVAFGIQLRGLGDGQKPLFPFGIMHPLFGLTWFSAGIDLQVAPPADFCFLLSQYLIHWRELYSFFEHPHKIGMRLVDGPIGISVL